MKKFIIILSTIILLIGVTAGFVFTKITEIEEMRAKITSISGTSDYYIAFNNSIDSILKKGKINKAHKPWIKSFVVKNLPKETYKESYLFLSKKLRNKNIQMTISQQKEVESEYFSIKSAAMLRKENVDNTIREYKSMRTNTMYSMIEDKFIGQPLKMEDIKYF